MDPDDMQSVLEELLAGSDYEVATTAFILIEIIQIELCGDYLPFSIRINEIVSHTQEYFSALSSPDEDQGDDQGEQDYYSSDELVDLSGALEVDYDSLDDESADSPTREVQYTTLRIFQP